MSKADSISMIERSSSGKEALRGLHGVRVPFNSCDEEDPCPAEDHQSHRSAAERHRLLLKSHTFDNARKVQQVEQFPLRRLWKKRPSLFMLPLPHKHGDCHVLETLANVLTSVPFIFIGLQAPRKKFVTKLYANSVVGVGLASSLYHTSRGDVRKVFRWGDYAMISTSALCLSRALRSENQRAFIVASALLLPFKPSLVTAIHTGLTEATFYRRVNADPGLRRAHTLHAASSLVGCALFVADGMLPNTPFLHAAWHLAAAIGVATYNKLLE